MYIHTHIHTFIHTVHTLGTYRTYLRHIPSLSTCMYTLYTYRICTYIYTYVYAFLNDTYMYIYIYKERSPSLSLSLYIYVYAGPLWATRLRRRLLVTSHCQSLLLQVTSQVSFLGLPIAVSSSYRYLFMSFQISVTCLIATGTAQERHFTITVG